MIKAAIVFASMFALDFVWAKYTFAMTEKRSFLSGNLAGLIILLSGIATIGYVEDPWMLIPAAMGAWLGTVVAVEMKKQ